MRDPAGPPQTRSFFRSSLALWLVLFLAPIAGLAVLLSQAGSAWLDRGAARPVGAATLPGFTIEATRSPSSHLVVTSVRSANIHSGRPATGHGIAVGDTIVAIDGARIFSLDQVRRSLQKSRAETMALRVARDGELHDVQLVRGEGRTHGSKASHRRR